MSNAGGGYGRKTILGRVFKAHRLAYEMEYGPIPDGMVVCHKCDNPPCVNPEHLFLGTQADNTADRHRKGRTAKGTGIPSHKLDEESVRQVRVLRELGMSQSAIGYLFGVSGSAVGYVLRGEVWKSA